ncbi:hypothetical protein D3C87_109490 [compost metagenome]
MMTYINRQISEIQKSKVLTLFGVFLTLVHVATWYNWFFARPFVNEVLTERTPICWSYFTSCDLLRPFDPAVTQFMSIFYLTLTLLALFLVLTKRVKLFWWAFLLLTVFKWSMLSLDYRFMGNYHYMPFVASLVYLFVSSKKRFLPLALISFYMAAGILKFTPEWYSGNALLEPAIVDGKLLEISLVYVIYLEILFVWGLLSKHAWLKWFTFIQIFAFHIFSWHIVGYFYPVVMFNLIVLFPLLWLIPERDSESLRWSRSGIAFLAIFWIAQAVPFVFYKDSARTGQGRLISFNMLDARTACDSMALIKKDREQMLVSIPAKDFGVRIQCDPNVYVALIKEECQKWKAIPGFIDMDYRLHSKLSTEPQGHETLKLDNVCSQPPQVTFFGEVYQ